MRYPHFRKPSYIYMYIYVYISWYQYYQLIAHVFFVSKAERRIFQATWCPWAHCGWGRFHLGGQRSAQAALNRRPRKNDHDHGWTETMDEPWIFTTSSYIHPFPYPDPLKCWMGYDGYASIYATKNIWDIFNTRGRASNREASPHNTVGTETCTKKKLKDRITPHVNFFQ